MNKLLWRYLIYFGIFICFVQIMESAPLQGAFAKVGLKMNFEALGTYAPLFLSALLIDITYRIGKRQNEIAERQNEIAVQQNELAKKQNEITEQQRRDMEYQINRDLYSVVCNADGVIKQFLISCCFGMEWGKSSLIRNVEEIENAKTQLDSKKFDIELRFPSKWRVLHDYDFCFSVMLFVLDILLDVVGEDGCSNFEISSKEWIELTNKDRANVILEGITNLELKTKLEKDFEWYQNTLEYITEVKLAQTIKEYIITNDDTRKN